VFVSGIENDEVDQVGFRPEVADDQDIGLSGQKPLHEPANRCLKHRGG
jgi:hypothetical protein